NRSISVGPLIAAVRKQDVVLYRIYYDIHRDVLLAFQTAQDTHVDIHGAPPLIRRVVVAEFHLDLASSQVGEGVHLALTVNIKGDARLVSVNDTPLHLAAGDQRRVHQASP